MSKESPKKLGRIIVPTEELDANTPHLKELFGEMMIYIARPAMCSGVNYVESTEYIATHDEFDEIGMSDYIPQYQVLFEIAEDGTVKRLPFKKIKE